MFLQVSFTEAKFSKFCKYLWASYTPYYQFTSLSEMKIVFLERDTIPKHIQIPRPSFPHEWVEYGFTKVEEVFERIKNAEIIIVNKVLIKREVMEKCPKLKLIAVAATGMNNIDHAAAKEFGITVKNVTGYSSVSLPEHVLGLIYSLKHSIHLWARDQLTDRWSNSNTFCYFDHPITDVKGSTIGIIGKGNLGSEVGRLAQLVGMNVLYAEHRDAKTIREGYTKFEDVLAQSDIITLHCPLTDETNNIINESTINMMKPGVMLINTGRGALIDSEAVIKALESGKIGSAAIDVMIKEPPEKGNVIMEAAKRLPNLIVTPHVAWSSDSAVETLVNKVKQNIEDFVANSH